MYRLVMLACVLVTVASPVAAQTVTATTGAINGTVVDTTKAVVPGVTITLSGPAVMGTPTAVTDQTGSYRFSALAPGEYTLVFELAGFGTVTREGIRIGVGFIATVNAEIQPGGVNESLTVTGGAPVVDVTSAGVSTRFDTERMASLTGARDFFSTLAMAPAVVMQKLDVGGSGALNQYTYTSYGIGGNHHEVEGIFVGNGNNFYYPDMASFEEVSVQAVGNTAEMPSPGAYSRFVSKSGGNHYHGGMYAEYQNSSLQAHNISADQLARGVQGGPGAAAEDTNRIKLFRDFQADVGGYLKKDKLWWYGGYRYTKIDLRFPFLIDDSQAVAAPVYTLKATYNVNQQQKLIAYYNYTNRKQDNYFLGPQPLITRNAVPRSAFPTNLWKVEYNAAVSNSVYADVRWGGISPRFRNGRRTRVIGLSTSEPTAALVRRLRVRRLTGA